jgi:hypothetical protein
LFTTDLLLAFKAQQAGVDGVIVDWESRGKQARQQNHPLETNFDTPQDVYNLSRKLKIPVIVRVNQLGTYTASEINCALNNGAKIVMLPMARSVAEVRTFLRLVDGRAKTIIQIETPSLASEVKNLRSLEWDYAYIGLNDLMVATGHSSIWQALFDGTAESICTPLKGRTYGFGGSTILGGGEPIINSLILHELVRLGGAVSILRRTFKKELLDRDFNLEMQALREFVKCSEIRGPLAMAHDHEHLLRILKAYLTSQPQSMLEKIVV